MYSYIYVPSLLRAEFATCRVGYVPSWLCAELVMCRVDPPPVLHVNKFDEIMGSNLNRIRPYLCFRQTN